MSQNLVLKNKGLFTNSNQLSAVPEGANTVAKNIVIDKDDVAESRRGFGLESNPASSTDVRNDRVTSFQDKLIVHRLNDNSMAYKVDGVGYTNFSGTYPHPDADYARMQFLQANGNLYFSTSTGVKVLDVYSGPIYSTGMPRGLDGVGSTTGASGMMANNTQVAYRVVWGSRDANNNLYLGTPSQRIIVSNSSGGTRDVSLTFTIPDGISTSDFFQVYRSKESASSTDEPNDELQLVYEKNPTAGQITAKAVTFTDSTPVSLMGASLYTNASQEGIAESNDEPPFAKDIALFKNYTFFAGVKTKHNLNIKLLSAGGSGLVNDDTITINGVVFTGKAAETIASGFFKISTGGSASQNIADTAQSLVKVINQYTSNTTVYAYYTSGFQDLPGQIQLIMRTLGDTSFPVAVSRASAWELGTAVSSNDNFINGLMWGKNQQPEHVPTAHIEFIGSKNYPIRRIIALRDSLFILKTDGVFRLTGSGGSWSVDPLDTSTRIIAPDSAAVINNQIFCLSDQGIVAISDIGVQVMSRPIEDKILTLVAEDYENLKKLSFGVSYETDRKYVLFTIALDADTTPTKAFVYNTFTQAWTEWEKDAVHAFVNPTDDKIYLCNPDNKYVYVERKNLDFTDYADEELLTFSIVSSSGLSVVLNTTVGLEVGYLLYESASKYSVITAIAPTTNTITVNETKTWTVGSTTILKNVPCELEYTAQHFDNPGIMKHFQEVALLFRDTNFISGILSFYTDLSGGYDNTTIYGSFGGSPWGGFAWGSTYWGGLQRPKPIRVFVTRDKSRGTILSCKLTMGNAYAKWSLNGMSLIYEWTSERTSRS
jgi:hypothetical protein